MQEETDTTKQVAIQASLMATRTNIPEHTTNKHNYEIKNQAASAFSFLAEAAILVERLIGVRGLLAGGVGGAIVPILPLAIAAATPTDRGLVLVA